MVTHSFITGFFYHRFLFIFSCYLDKIIIIIIQRHNELRDFEAEMLRMVFSDAEIEPVLQEITGESLNGGFNRVVDAWLDIHADSFWER